jgi:hypothetical protein
VLISLNRFTRSAILIPERLLNTRGRRILGCAAMCGVAAEEFGLVSQQLRENRP